MEERREQVAKKEKAKDYISLPIPFGLVRICKEVVLDSSSYGKTMDEGMGYISDHIAWDDEETMERIFRATLTLYYTNKASSLGECLHTALIWELG